jgi:major membrane immunogen (membrane-anchored lipoprotein)
MWLEKIEEFRKENKQALDLKLELHLAIYIHKILQGDIDFSINDNGFIIKKENKKITLDELFYWWQITRFDELLSEEEIIFNDFNILKDKITKAITNVKNPELNDDDSKENKTNKEKKIIINNEKIKKLEEHLSQEANKSNIQINALKQFRFMYTTYESFEKFTKSVRILIQNTPI